MLLEEKHDLKELSLIQQYVYVFVQLPHFDGVYDDILTNEKYLS